ncbi:Acetoin utilization deacetylase AcuC [Cupriavidus sp. YR651]|uniref:histone deacetylase family protein n=1 Tax=Cupriavidus sp. YR651 TaxID=1855315 RepID=UPI00088FDD0A|nr:histone deacetylase [Cupriavidus sp. YR651]SDD04702.1 Acetoin utilization deacetylase AcuC [Cupriavidus sp. YR651]
MLAFYADHFVLPLPPGHRFPMRKYSMLRDAVVREVAGIELREAPRADDNALRLAHTADYIAEVSAGRLDAARQREIGFPWSHEMVERSRRSAGATIAACRTAMEEGVAVNLAGGTHHAYADKGGGFCVFNDAAIAARQLQRDGRVRRVAVIDLDVHQGNGTASILRDDPTIFTLSLHGEKNYPFRKEASDLDVGLPDGCDDDGYAAALVSALDALYARFNPELLIYLAGADPHEGDRLGRLRLTLAGLARRDTIVFESALARRLPIAVAMAGGYGNQIEDTVAVHTQTVGLAAHYHARYRAVGADSRASGISTGVVAEDPAGFPPGSSNLATAAS